MRMNNDLVCVLASYLTPFEVVRLSVTCKALHVRFSSARVWKVLLQRYLPFSLRSVCVEGWSFRSFMQLITSVPGKWRRRGQLRLLLSGPSATGKTSLMRCFTEGLTPSGEHVVTMGFEFGVKSIVLGRATSRTNLQIWDSSGLPMFRNAGASHIRSMNAILFFFDVSNPRSWSMTVQHAVELYGNCNCRAAQIHVFCVAAKADLAGVTDELHESVKVNQVVCNFCHIF